MLELDDLDLPGLEYLTRKEIQAIEYNEFMKFSSAFELMTNAGKACAEYVRSKFETGSSIIFLIGPGNNGGDGYIAVSHLMDEFNISIVRIHEPKTEAAKQAATRINSNKVQIYTFPEQDISHLFDNANVVVDSVFGVGLTSEPRPPYDKLLTFLSNCSCPIISIDLPSGLDCDQYHWYGPEFKPHSVVTMHVTKSVMKSWDLNCEVIVADIGFDRRSAFFVDKGHVTTFWKPRDPDSHKGQNGRIMVIGGSDEFTGAPVLTGKAILRSGVDTLRIAVPESIRDIVAGYNQDFIVVKTRGERHNSKSFKRFRDLARQRHDVIVMGMGMANHTETRKFVREIVPELQDHVRLVLDADAIRPFKNHLDDIKTTGAIITPHHAELRHLLQEHVPREMTKLVPFLMKSAADLGLVILLKGKIDMITDGSKILFNTTGTSAMTVGGTGDVLAGVVSAVNCFVQDKFYATAIAAHIMGLAGERVTDELGIGLLASDIIEQIPYVLKEMEIM